MASSVGTSAKAEVTPERNVSAKLSSGLKSLIVALEAEIGSDSGQRWLSVMNGISKKQVFRKLER